MDGLGHISFSACVAHPQGTSPARLAVARGGTFSVGASVDLEPGRDN